jgi:histidyl-tRNA synthetase
MPPSGPIKAARGVRDILPSELPLWHEAEAAAEATARRYGYEEIVTPLIEPADLIERIGTETDAVAKELYRLERPGTQTLALRPEATAGVVRAYFENGLNQAPRLARLYLIGPMFRHDRPQKGRYRQFYQFNVEVIGGGSPAFDAEVVELAQGWLKAVGVDRLRLELNSIGDEKCRPAYLDRLREYYRPLRSQLHGDCQLRLDGNPLRLLDCKVPQCQPLKANAPRITDHLCEECAAHWAVVRRLLEAAGIEYLLNPHLVRGLDYYTRTVFEFYPGGATGQQDALASGGRYDGLAAAEGWPDTPGVGFAGGLDRVVELMRDRNPTVAGAPVADVLVIADGDIPVEAAEVARICRTVRRTAVDYELRNFRAKMRLADTLGVRWAVIVNPGQAVRRVARVREMASGAESEVGWDALPSRLA